MKKILIVGLGLIGASIAKSLKRNTDNLVYGIDISEDVMLDACSCGAIDGKADLEHICNSDIIYLCTYPDAAVEFVQKYSSNFKKGTIITDTCGTKTEICRKISEIDGDFTFIGGHPMSGKEKSGFSASDPSIFVGASYIITPLNAPQTDVDVVCDLAKKMGFGKIVSTTPENHDKLIAFTSQLPHIIACSYVQSPACEDHKGFSAGSYRDVSRVADINSELWTSLFLENREMLTKELEVFIENIKEFYSLIKDNDKDNLQKKLENSAEIKRRDLA